MARRSLGCIDDYSALHGCWGDGDDGDSGGADADQDDMDSPGGAGIGEGPAGAAGGGAPEESGFEDAPAGFGGNPAMGADGFSEHGGYGGYDQGYGAPGGPGFGGPMASDVGWGSRSNIAPTTGWDALTGLDKLGAFTGLGGFANALSKAGTGYGLADHALTGARSFADSLGIGPKDIGTMSGQPEGPEGTPANNSQPGSGYGNNPNSDDGGYGPGPINPVKILPALRSPLQDELLNPNRTTRFTGGPQGPWSGNLYEVPQPSLQRSLMRG